MAPDPINAGYARALFEMARAENAVDRIEEDLRRLKRLLETNPEILEFLKDRNIEHEGKRRALVELFGGRVHPLVLDTLVTISDQDRSRRIPAITEEYEAIVASERGSVSGEVVTAVPLDEATLERMAIELVRLTGKNVQLYQRVDPSILGGAVINVGGQVIDGSLRRKLRQIQEHMTQP